MVSTCPLIWMISTCPLILMISNYPLTWKISTCLLIWKISTCLLVWMISTYPLIPKFTNSLGIVPSAKTTIGITITMFHCFFSSLASSRHLFIVSPFFTFILWSAGRQSPLFGRFSFWLSTIIWSDHLTKTRWSVCISKSQRSLCVSFSRTDSGLCIYDLFAWSNLL